MSQGKTRQFYTCNFKKFTVEHDRLNDLIYITCTKSNLNYNTKTYDMIKHVIKI